MDKKIEEVVRFLEKKKREIEGEYMLNAATLFTQSVNLDLENLERGKICSDIETLTKRAKMLGILEGKLLMLCALCNKLTEIEGVDDEIDKLPE